ncbi:hypothetical protein BX666DRAFT_2119515 [Dichotomocladium elegans]|nr:hypothetical protein BX666DRAFT_2119515 [Dichotomocladium elegans]
MDPHSKDAPSAPYTNYDPKNEPSEGSTSAASIPRQSSLPPATRDRAIDDVNLRDNFSGSVHLASHAVYTSNEYPEDVNGSRNASRCSSTQPQNNHSSQFKRDGLSHSIDSDLNHQPCSEKNQKAIPIFTSRKRILENNQVDASAHSLKDLSTASMELSPSARDEEGNSTVGQKLLTDTPSTIAYVTQETCRNDHSEQPVANNEDGKLPINSQIPALSNTPSDSPNITGPELTKDSAGGQRDGYNSKRRKSKNGAFKAQSQEQLALDPSSVTAAATPAPPNNRPVSTLPGSGAHGLVNRETGIRSSHYSSTTESNPATFSEHHRRTSSFRHPYGQQVNSTPNYASEAIRFLQEVKMVFRHHPDKYNRFLDIMKAARLYQQPMSQTIACVSELFYGYPWLISGFNYFIPQGYHITNSPETNAHYASNRKQVEFSLAIRFVNFAKQRLSNKPGAFAQFQRMLYDFEEMRCTATDVRFKAETLFGDDPVLMGEFLRFLPASDAYQSMDRYRSNTIPEDLHHTSKKQKISTPGRQIQFGQENLAFFARVKELLGNDQTYSMFLKVINLFNQGMIDRESTVRKASDFLQGDPQLFAKFKEMLAYHDSGLGENSISRGQNAPTKEPPRQRRQKMTFESSGPSYRRISKAREMQRCSGRDDLCSQVLNDKYASHPIWASEDGGFVASKKNQFEEVLHNVEEQRYELDRLIDSGSHLFGLLNRISDTMRTFSPDQLRNYRAPQYLGARSELAYKVAVQKLYNKDADKILALMYANPSQTIPAVLKLLQTKLDEWKKKKAAQDKTWKEDETENFYKALDSRCATFKSTDKQALSIKSLVTEIECMRFEQQMDNDGDNTPQIVHEFTDRDIFTDIEEILTTFNANRVIYGESVVRNIQKFFATFVHPLIKADPPVKRDAEVNGFLANDTLYCFFRLYQILYERLETMKNIASKYANDPEGTKRSCRAQIDLSCRKTQYHGVKLDFTNGYYTTMVDLIKRLLANSIDQSTFEACVRYIFGLKAYVLFTIDRLLFALSHQAYIAVTDLKSRELVELYRSEEGSLPEPSLTLLLPYRLKAEDIQKDEGHLYALFISVPSGTNKITISISVLGNIYIEGKKEAQKYHNYVQYLKSLGDDTDILLSASMRKPFLKRNVKEFLDVRGEVGQEYKVCQNTYRLFYVTGTEDYLKLIVQMDINPYTFYEWQAHYKCKGSRALDCFLLE